MDSYATQLAESVGEVFATMMGLPVEPVPDPRTPASADKRQFTAVIGFGGEDSGGLIYFHCDETFAFRATSAMLGVDVSGDRDSVIDALGEIANMIGGNFKGKTSEFDRHKLSLPSVIVGHDYKTHTPGGRQGDLLGFSSGDTRFLVQFFLKR